MTMIYTLKDFTDITFNGFDFKLPEDTLITISELSQQVGSPSYIKTPIFQKKELAVGLDKKKKRTHKSTEVLNDADWETLRTFQTTTIEQKSGIEMHVDTVRSLLNKMSDKLYLEPCEKIIEILESLILENTSDADMLRIGTIIFEIASNNRFYSKLYADLYSTLISRFQIMDNIFNTNLSSFMNIFECIEYVDSEKDYDKFCKINKDNEHRKALSLFFVNLNINGIISDEKMYELASNLLNKLLLFIENSDNKNEVDEITENIVLIYNKTKFVNYTTLFNGQTYIQVIHRLAHSKPKMHPSLSNKSIFKFMDLIEM
jgi:hypothetical protein